MAVRQKSGGLPENEKRPPPSQRYDRTAAIQPQKWMPARPTSSTRYDTSPANFMTPIKSVTSHSSSVTENSVMLPSFAAS
jgi:hypothetical protein